MITAYGYLKVRESLEDTITHIEIRNGASAITRIPVTDPRITVYDDATATPLGYQVVMSATDTEFPVGTTITGYGLYDVDTAGSPLFEDTFRDGGNNPVVTTFNNTADKITAKINLNTAL